MSVLTLEAKLERLDPNTPWGFRMQGGKEFNSALTIQKVNPGSLAAKCGLQTGDVILKIGPRASDSFCHKDAQDAIVNSGNKLDLLLQRYWDKNRKSTLNIYSGGGGVPQYDIPSINPNIQSKPSQNYNPSPKPFGQSSQPNKPYGAVDNLSNQTQNLNLNNPTSGPPSQGGPKIYKNPTAPGSSPQSQQQQAPPWASQPAKPAPAPAQSAPKQWQPAKQPSAPAPKWSPSAAPAPAPAPAPAAAPSRPRGPPPKPTGVGATRGKRGDARMDKGDPGRTPICDSCAAPIRGPFVVAMGKTWCPDHFVCANAQCGTKLIDIGFVEEGGYLYCETDYGRYFAAHCAVCGSSIMGECVNALQKQYHPACFTCAHCHKPIGGNQFHMEENKVYCNADWTKLYQQMCSGCDFPIEPGDKWLEAMGQNFHSGCFNCSTCQVSLEGQGFVPKGGKAYCKRHAR